MDADPLRPLAHGNDLNKQIQVSLVRSDIL